MVWRQQRLGRLQLPLFCLVPCPPVFTCRLWLVIVGASVKAYLYLGLVVVVVMHGHSILSLIVFCLVLAPSALHCVLPRTLLPFLCRCVAHLPSLYAPPPPSPTCLFVCLRVVLDLVFCMFSLSSFYLLRVSSLSQCPRSLIFSWRVSFALLWRGPGNKEGVCLCERDRDGYVRLWMFVDGFSSEGELCSDFDIFV